MNFGQAAPQRQAFVIVFTTARCQSALERFQDLAANPADVPPRFFESADGQRLAFCETGEGPPVVLIHGFFSNAWTNWIRFGHAAKIAAKGFRVIMPDLRAHGDSAAPHDPAAYPPDILAEDGLALIAHLGLTDYDLGGYSLGARTAVRMHAKGARPKRIIVAGMGLSGLTHLASRADHFRHILTNLDKHPRGTNEFMAEAFLKTTGGDPAAMLLMLETFANTDEADIRAIDVPTLILAGEKDDDNGSHEDLAALIPKAIRRETPGGHMSAITKPEFGEAIAAFLMGWGAASLLRHSRESGNPSPDIAPIDSAGDGFPPSRE